MVLLGNDPETANVYLRVIQGATLVTFVVKVLTFGCSLSEVCKFVTPVMY